MNGYLDNTHHSIANYFKFKVDEYAVNYFSPIIVFIVLMVDVTKSPIQLPVHYLLPGT